MNNITIKQLIVETFVNCEVNEFKGVNYEVESKNLKINFIILGKHLSIFLDEFDLDIKDMKLLILELCNKMCDISSFEGAQVFDNRERSSNADLLFDVSFDKDEITKMIEALSDNPLRETKEKIVKSYEKIMNFFRTFLRRTLN